MRKLLIDADLPKRLQTELTYRGRTAESLSSLRLNRSKDPVVLGRIRDDFDLDRVVFVTGDDQMLLEHREHALGITIAVVDPDVPEGFVLDQWRRECVHRWAHMMVEQESATWVRYGLRKMAWKQPRRRRRPKLVLPDPSNDVEP